MQEQHRIEHDLLKKKQLVELNILKEKIQVIVLLFFLQSAPNINPRRKT